MVICFTLRHVSLEMSGSSCLLWPNFLLFYWEEEEVHLGWREKEILGKNSKHPVGD